MSATKIIFLDFDGPLSNLLVALGNGSMHAFDPVTIRALNTLCAFSGAKIVCTSTRAQTWMPEKRDMAVAHFEKGGLDLKHIHTDWSCRYETGSRKEHILQWLAEHPEVTHTVIVDDFAVDLPNLVLVSPYDGLNLQHFVQIAAALDIDLTAALNWAKDNNPENAGTDYRIKRLKMPTLNP